MMSVTQTSQQTTKVPNAAVAETKLEVIVLPVADVERSKRFYESLGWRLDADFDNGDNWRAVQLTPPGSPCSIIFGKGFTKAVPGSVQGLFLVVSDLDAARAVLLGQGVDVSEVFHFSAGLHVLGTKGRVPGRDPQGRSYLSFVSFNDPDGNAWLVQEVTARLPGRGFSNLDIPTLTELLREAEQQHGVYTATAPKHHWSDWYSAYIVARQQGKSPEEAAQAGARHLTSASPAAGTSS
jgi:catechol 2,3-dioxygenase-like lactoylglutathione lyase family enzyme